jgi:hypothetical protein
MGRRYHGLIGYMALSAKEGLAPKEAVRRLLLGDRIFGAYRRAFVEEKYPELLGEFDRMADTVALLRDK